MEAEITIKKYTCERCGYSWISRINTLPKFCSKCKSPSWNIPRGKERIE